MPRQPFLSRKLVSNLEDKVDDAAGANAGQHGGARSQLWDQLLSRGIVGLLLGRSLG